MDPVPIARTSTLERRVTFRETPQIRLLTPVVPGYLDSDAETPEFQSRWSFWSRDQHRHQQHPQQQYAPPTSSPNPQPYERMTSTSDSWLRCSDPGAPPPPGGPSSATNQRHQYNKKARPQHSSNGMNTNTVNGNSSRSSSSGGWMASLKRAAKALKREVLAVYYAMQAPDTPLLSKCLAALVLAYALSPLDLIPDFIPVLGILDDLVLLPLLIWAAIAFIPPDTMEAARRRAEQEPLRLSRNWLTAVLIFLMWTGCLEWLVYFLVQRYGTPPMKQYMWYGMGGLAAVLCVVFGVWMRHKLAKERRKRAKAEAEAEAAVRQRLLQGEGEEEAGIGTDVESGGLGPGRGPGQGEGVHVHAGGGGGANGGCCGGEGGSLDEPLLGPGEVESGGGEEGPAGGAGEGRGPAAGGADLV